MPSTSPQHSMGTPQNPPRKVRRLRELALKDNSSSSPEFQLSTVPVALPEAVQRPPSPSTTAAPRRRGRKPAGPLSKTAREQLRKTNHSVIEKRRREKINEALAALRQLVPNEKAHDSDKKEKEDREFKLEILVRTVDYLNMMVDKMKGLENGMCVKCGGNLATNHPQASSSAMPSPIEPERLVKRKRAEYEAEEDSAHEEDGLDEEDLEAQSSPPFLAQTINNAHTPAEPTPRIRLPSISSWMVNAPASPLQLPSPPQSVPFTPTAVATGFLPGLLLPPPIRSQPGTDIRNSSTVRNPIDSPAPLAHISDSSPLTYSLGSKQSLFRPNSSLATPRHETQEDIEGMIRNSKNSTPLRRDMPLPPTTHSHSPAPWSRDDQTAASLLLNFSSRHSTSGSEDSDERQRDESESNKPLCWQTPYCGPQTGVLEAQTPSSMLGMPPGGT